MRSFQKGTVWPCSLKDFKVTSVQSWMFAWNACFGAIYIVNCASIFTVQTLKAGSSAILQPKDWAKKTTHFLDMIAQQILILELKMIKQGQNKISRALIWGKVGLCRPNMTRDMIKKKKQGFSKNVNLCYKNAKYDIFWKSLF